MIIPIIIIITIIILFLRRKIFCFGCIEKRWNEAMEPNVILLYTIEY